MNGSSRRRLAANSSKVLCGLVLDDVPLVDGDHEALPLLDHVAGHVRVLRGQAVGGVEDEHGDVGARDRLEGAERRVALGGRARCDLAALANARGVDQDDLAATPRDRRVDGVAGRAGRVGHDRSRLAQERVEEARLADVGPTDERDRRRLVVLGGHHRVPAGRRIGTSPGSSSPSSPVVVACVLAIDGVVVLARRERLDPARGHVVGPRLGLGLADLARESRPRSPAAAPTRPRRAGPRPRARGWPRWRTSPPSRTRRTPRRRARAFRCRPCWRRPAPAWSCAAGALTRPGRAGVGPVAASTMNTITSASLIASLAWSWTWASIGSPGEISSPPVSTTTKRRPFHSASPYRRSRVVRARSSTIAARSSPTTRLNSVLLPTFGRPTRATTGRPAERATTGYCAPAGAAAGVWAGSEVVRPAG